MINWLTEYGSQLDQQADCRDLTDISDVLVPHDGFSHAIGLFSWGGAFLVEQVVRDDAAVELKG